MPFQQMVLEKLDLIVQKKKNSIHTFTKIKSRDHWPKCKMQNVKLLEESRRKFCDYGLVTDFFRYRKDKS